jgi:DNA-binding CsgD family transcriptional regulator
VRSLGLFVTCAFGFGDVMKNGLIDTLDALLFSQDQQDRWHAAQRAADKIGVKSILVAQAVGIQGDIRWMNTDMPSDWIEEYLACGYVEVDPPVLNLSKQKGNMSVDCGVLHRGDASDKREWDLNHGLKAAGFGSLFCSCYKDATGYDRFVTLAYDGHHLEDQPASQVELQLFSALLASTIERDTVAPGNGYQPARPSPLTQRQREVLSLLAEGMMTARIAETLGLSEAAVSLHFANARKALGASTREHALALALTRGFISL